MEQTSAFFSESSVLTVMAVLAALVGGMGLLLAVAPLPISVRWLAPPSVLLVSAALLVWPGVVRCRLARQPIDAETWALVNTLLACHREWEPSVAGWLEQIGGLTGREVLALVSAHLRLEQERESAELLQRRSTQAEERARLAHAAQAASGVSRHREASGLACSLPASVGAASPRRL